MSLEGGTDSTLRPKNYMPQLSLTSKDKFHVKLLVPDFLLVYRLGLMDESHLPVTYLIWQSEFLGFSWGCRIHKSGNFTKQGRGKYRAARILMNVHYSPFPSLPASTYTLFMKLNNHTRSR